jgi:manganese/zinc/iron transport system permease protein
MRDGLEHLVLASAAWPSVFGQTITMDDIWVILTAMLACVACGVVGVFLVLRRLSLLGDAISHAILPGLAGAFLLSGSRNPLLMLGGAMVMGLLTVACSAGLRRLGGARVPHDAAMGVVFTTFFALGVILISLAARDVDLDPGCVLYGMIEFVPFDVVRVFGVSLPRSAMWLGVTLVVVVAVIVVFYKELQLLSFDAGLAAAMGFSVGLIHYGLMALITLTTVASFEAVGSVLVIAMLVAPGATAHLLTDRLPRMLWISAVIAAGTAIAGYGMALWLNTSVAGSIATVALGVFMLTALGAPRHGIIAKLAGRAALQARIAREDLLGVLYRLQENPKLAAQDGADLATAAHLLEMTKTGVLGRIMLMWLRACGRIEQGPRRHLVLTPAGLAEAGLVVRGHRLWETYLAKRLGVDPQRLHSKAHAAEHYLSAGLQAKLDADLRVKADPHGRVIPPGS